MWQAYQVLRSLVLLGLVGFFAVGCSKEARKGRYVEKANRYFEAGQYDKAEIEYLNALRLDGKNPVVIRGLATIFYDQGRTVSAFTFLSRAKALAPDDAEIQTKLASILLSGRQTAKAREEALSILTKDPAHPEAIRILAEAAVTVTRWPASDSDPKGCTNAKGMARSPGSGRERQFRKDGSLRDRWPHRRSRFVLPLDCRDLGPGK